MDQEGEIQTAVLCEQFPEVECFVQHYTYFRSLRGATHPVEDSNFWDEVSTAFLRSATLTWCNVFGSCRGDLHWSKLIKNMPKKVKEDFINRIYMSTHLNEKSYKKLRDYIKTLRDKYFAHKDLNSQNHIWNSPDFDNAMKIASVYEKWVNDLLDKEGSSCPGRSSLDDIKTEAERQIEQVLGYKARRVGLAPP